MSRSKKSRSIKSKVNIKTGSKKALIDDRDRGKIASKNKLKKHKKRQKSAYQKHLEENQLQNEGQGKAQTVKGSEPRENDDATKTMKNESVVQTGDQPKETTQTKEKDFDQLSGEDLLDLFEGDS